MKNLLALTVLVLFMVSPAFCQTGIIVNDAKLGKSVENRQIADEASTFAVNDKVYVWLKVTGAGAGESLPVTWKTADRTYNSNLPIGGSPWRTWCYKIVAVPGDWTVTISDAKGVTLKELKFTVSK